MLRYIGRGACKVFAGLFLTHFIAFLLFFFLIPRSVMLCNSCGSNDEAGGGNKMTGIENAYDECLVGGAVDTSIWEKSDGAVGGGFSLHFTRSAWACLSRTIGEGWCDLRWEEVLSLGEEYIIILMGAAFIQYALLVATVGSDD